MKAARGPRQNCREQVARRVREKVGGHVPPQGFQRTRARVKEIQGHMEPSEGARCLLGIQFLVTEDSGPPLALL